MGVEVGRIGDGTSTGTVVVGLDGSPGSRAALEHALEDAARRGSRLRVVTAARLPEYWATAYGMDAPPPPSDVLADVRSGAQRLVDDVTAQRPDLVERVPITVEATGGSPAEVLLEACEGADLLVLGHRGRGGLASTVLGSVGLRCVLHATCPVTVVRPTVAQRAADVASPAAAPAPAPV